MKNIQKQKRTKKNSVSAFEYASFLKSLFSLTSGQKRRTSQARLSSSYPRRRRFISFELLQPSSSSFLLVGDGTRRARLVMVGISDGLSRGTKTRGPRQTRLTVLTTVSLPPNS